MKPLDYRLRVTLLVAGLLLGSAALAGGGFDDVRPASPGETLDAAVRRNVAAIVAHRRAARVPDHARDIAWLSAPTGDLTLFDTMRMHTFVVLAAPDGGDNRDLFRMEARVTPYGMVFDDAWIVNLTRTEAADESSLTADGYRVATTVRYEGRITAVEVRDLAGEDPVRAGVADWPLFHRLGNSVTNLERSGTRAGIDAAYYAVESDAGQDALKGELGLRFEGDALVLGDPGSGRQLARIDLRSHAVTGDLRLTHLPEQQKMRMQLLNWLADRGRGFADQGLLPQWAGVGVELLKEVYFKAEQVKADIEAAAASDDPVQVEEEEVVEKAQERARFQKEDRSLPWPPPPLEPMLGERAKGEGIWEEIGRNRVQHQPHAPPPFYRTFVRPDDSYSLKRVWITVWDPEQVSLRLRAGTAEPVPQTGHRGDGRIPRDPALLRRVVGGFNGGFQTAHIWYGMMVDRKVLLRPREYGATAGSWADGRTAFGTWPPNAAIPEELVAYRQNLPPLVEDGVFNPYGRRTWGWHKMVAGAKEGKTVRSALCYTHDGYVMYFYTEFADENALAGTLFHCGCQYGLHLDMNRGHTGLEYYRLLAEGETAVDPDATTEVEGVRFAGTTLHPEWKHMKAPVRYLGVDYRDFFYLTLRAVVPGADLTPLHEAEPGEGVWSLRGVSHNAEFPPRLATTWLTPDGAGRIDVLQLDPRAIDAQVLEPGAGTRLDHATLMAAIPLGDPAPGRRNASITLGGATVNGSAVDDAPQVAVPSATVIGLDPDGFALVLVVRDATIAAAAGVLRARGVEQAVWLPGSTGAEARLYQAIRSPDGERLVELLPGAEEGEVVTDLARTGRNLVVTARKRAPRIVRLFPDMKPRAKRR